MSMNEYPDESYNWGTMDAQQLHQTKREGSISIFGATLLASVNVPVVMGV